MHALAHSGTLLHVLACMCMLHALPCPCSRACYYALLHVLAHACTLLHALTHSCMSVLACACSDTRPCSCMHALALSGILLRAPCSHVRAPARSHMSLLTHAPLCTLLHIVAHTHMHSLACSGTLLRVLAHVCILLHAPWCPCTLWHAPARERLPRHGPACVAAIRVQHQGAPQPCQP